MYWYDSETMPRDGGGLRVLAWEEALRSLGYSVEIEGLNPRGPGSSRRPSLLTKAKRTLAPMPFSRVLPPLPASDLYVMTVPVVFKAAKQVIAREALIFDWMDLWSMNSRTMGASSFLSVPGGFTQSLIWKRRERQLPAKARFNTVAGYGDLTAIGRNAKAEWLPTPTHTFSSRGHERGPIQRVGFLGNFEYEPNEMSLRKFFRDFGHLLSENRLEIVVAGFGSERVRTWGVPATVLGSLDNLDSFYESIDAVIVPIDHGGGIKVKAVEALARGLTVFGTDHVRSGFSPDFGQWIRNIEELFQAEPIDAAIARKELGHSRLVSRFSQGAFTSSVDEILGRW
ncbi:glycosyltransferase [Cryobacterium sp. TMT1-62]|nr:glycosyltransferase [Cryobacterium sp. TMT1-62]